MAVSDVRLAEIPEYEADPTLDSDHAQLERYRAMAPLLRSPIGSFQLLRHADSVRVIEDGSTRQLETEGMELQGITEGPIYEFHKWVMLFANGEVHTRRRLPVARTFAYKLVDELRPAIAELAAGLVTPHLEKGPFDFLNGFAGVLPGTLIARILGVPESDRPQFTEWVLWSSRGLGIVNQDWRADIERNIAALMTYVGDLLADRRKAGQNDFLTDYVRKVDADGVLSPDEMRAQIAGLILAGSDTTRAGLCAILSQLLQHPEQWADFCADPDGLKRQAVNEGLRFDPPVASLPRIALRDIAIGDYRVPEGSIVAPSILASLRDPDVYADPHRFDMHRTDHPRWHIAFGHGVHRCLGEALARAELEEALAAIARTAPDTRLVGAPPKLAGLTAIRVIDRMEVAFA